MEYGVLGKRKKPSTYISIGINEMIINVVYVFLVGVRVRGHAAAVLRSV